MRIRTIKPEFWENEDLASCTAHARLLAIGLLNISDDEGYFRVTAPVLRGRLFPYEDVNVTELLFELEAIGYIALYDQEGKTYGHVVTFTEHQRINRKTASKIKPKLENSQPTHTQLSESSVSPQLPLTPGKGKGKGKGMERDISVETSESFAAPVPSKIPNCPHQKIVELFHETTKFPRVLKLTDGRKKTIGARWKDSDCNIRVFDLVFKKAAASDFLNGRTAKPFLGCSFDWILNPTNWNKILEGNYDNKRTNRAPERKSGMTTNIEDDEPLMGTKPPENWIFLINQVEPRLVGHRWSVIVANHPDQAREVLKLAKQEKGEEPQ